ncbi:cell division FtsA domain-containing protein [Mesobacillus jeotgali]|uniref:cell division FtsA domain-containing protein n=1 Tax=Mesobacillus jeotgali TaxID=129985 RepID=UPI002148BB11|nr:cell division FtsA domain-containing protein [Mesobacillus jeotgali]
MQLHNKLFALDIGTRSVVGIILEESAGQYEAIDIIVREHKDRSMLDGQIHDVLSVSEIIRDIKEELEVSHGPLTKVCVAAAGRALRTERSKAVVDISGNPMFSKQDILHLELSAVQLAQAAVAGETGNEQSHHYYCVGYSVLYYQLDGEVIGSLIDQRGSEASVEIIATFLPKVVVESLLAALDRAGLEMDALTLEPIAAINVLIPASMRRLNVALVDIGAGTSDIALTDTGTVIAYGMVPVAGDEITEAVSDEFLLDFPLAEKAKRELLENESISITDILGFETVIEKEEAIERIAPAIDRLAETIGKEILRLNNNKSPKAVMLVGGGSLTPDLTRRLSGRLNLPENRVAIRGLDAISSVSFASHITKGPELVTPIGIAIAAKQSPVQYHTVHVNGQPVRLFEVNKLTVGDCLLAAGIKMNKLYGKPGLAMIVSLNGKNVTIPGEHGQPPVLLKNGTPCTFDDHVDGGDHLTVIKGKDGVRAELTLEDLIGELPSKTIILNGQRYKISSRLTCNGLHVPIQQQIADRDDISFVTTDTVEGALKELNLAEILNDTRPFYIKIDGMEHKINQFMGKIYINGAEAGLHNKFEHLDDIRFEKGTDHTLSRLLEILDIQAFDSLPIFFNGQQIQLEHEVLEFFKEGTKLGLDELLYSGDQITTKTKDVRPFIFQDVFNFAQINIPKDSRGFTLLKNGETTAFDDPLAPGDELSITFENPVSKKTS